MIIKYSLQEHWIWIVKRIVDENEYTFQLKKIVFLNFSTLSRNNLECH